MHWGLKLILAHSIKIKKIYYWLHNGMSIKKSNHDNTLADSELKFWKDSPSIPLTEIELPIVVPELVLFSDATLSPELVLLSSAALAPELVLFNDAVLELFFIIVLLA